MNEAIIRKFILSKEEFERGIRPRGDMTYDEIKEKILERYKYAIEDIDKMLKKTEDSITNGLIHVRHNHKTIINPKSYKHINFTYWLFVFYLKEACAHTHITGAYRHYLISKCNGLKSALIFWQSLIDKIAYLLLELKDKAEEGTKKTAQVLACEEFPSYKESRKSFNNNRINWNNYNFKDLANNIKHRDDKFTELMDRVILRQESKDIEKLEIVFAEVFEVLPKNIDVLSNFLKKFQA